MIKKSIFVMLAVFGLNSVADNHLGSSGVDHMSDMMQSHSNEAEDNFVGAFELKYKVLGEESNVPSYRVRLGWKGEVNEMIKWGVGFSSKIEQSFRAPSLNTLKLEQAYVSYTPAEGFSIKAGKYGWKPKFHKKGILYDDDLYPAGVYVKYHTGNDTSRFYGKVAFYNLDADFKGPFSEGAVLKGKLGGKSSLSSEVTGGVYASVEYDGLLKSEEIQADPKTLAQLGVNFGTSSLAVPAGVFGVYATDAQNFSANHSFTGGIYFGSAGTPTSGEVQDFGVAVSYYDIHKNDVNTDFIDTDYVSAFKKSGVVSSPTEGDNASVASVASVDSARGVAVRAQYNLWDSTNIVAKYAFNLKGSDNQDAHSLIGELTFNF